LRVTAFSRLILLMNFSPRLASLLCSAVFISTILHAETPAPIVLWPKGAPGEKGDIGEEKNQSPPKPGEAPGKSIIRLANVSNPTITLFRAPKEKDTGAAVVVCPGGGYNILAMDLEGTEICDWLNSIGVNAVLLKYRVSRRAGLEKHTAPLQDVQRAMGVVRQRAVEWGIDPKRIGVIGFSAGGHLAAALGAHFDKRTYEPVDEADQLSCRPDFSMLIYPAYLTGEKDHTIPPDVAVSAQTPPTFIVQTEDDKLVESTPYYYMALRAAKVPAEMHLYPSGGHGYGLRASDKTVATWPKRAEDWLRASGELGAKK
jgi:acetyl esterase/lipase